MSPRQPAYELVEVWTTAEATPQPPHRRHDYNNWSVRGEVMFVNFGSQVFRSAVFPILAHRAPSRPCSATVWPLDASRLAIAG